MTMLTDLNLIFLKAYDVINVKFLSTVQNKSLYLFWKLTQK